MTNTVISRKFAAAQSLYQQGRFLEAATGFEEMIALAPDDYRLYEYLANSYQQADEGEKAIACYQKLLGRAPHLADSHYNLGILLKQHHHYDAAIAAYGEALKYNISRPEEVHLNMAVIYTDHLRQEQKARAALETALKLKPDYISAQFNLANLYEQSGDKAAAEGLFRKIIDRDPFYYPALARLGEVRTFTDPDDPVIRRLKRGARKSTIELSTRINLYFSLGKALNDCGQYDEAFQYYNQANYYNKQTVSPYDKLRQQQLTDDLIQQFSREWFDRIEPVSTARPIFICGMFRSGSTLTEQIFASHPLVTAGGEVDFFVRQIEQQLAPYPASLAALDHAKLGNLARDYLDHLKKLFPAAGYITDKRPDNFLHLGLLKSLFPNARMIYTSRNALDNCLSVYFLRLGNGMNYATDLENIAHYYNQCHRLMSHWKALFGHNIHEVNYDDLVREPEPVIAALLNFCDLDWSDDCLQFHRLDNIVKTASVWQVREPLYQKSSGRWRNFGPHIGPLQQALLKTQQA
ncbi:MAG: tetratricopeptide repeat protein [Alphaproteobacteria bacterium]|nr:tetratricopeptide repeat protein [Alphaproteobacteria bacterium]